MSPAPNAELAAIMFTDIVGYTALMAESEERGCGRRTGTARWCDPWYGSTTASRSRRVGMSRSRCSLVRSMQ